VNLNPNTSAKSCELTDDELDAVNGGRIDFFSRYVINVDNLMSQFLTGGSQTGGWHGSH
jgi:bacteriocin-like protein